MSLLQILLLATLSIALLYAVRAVLRLVFARAIQDTKLKTLEYYLAHGLSTESDHYRARIQLIQDVSQAFATMSFVRMAVLLSYKGRFSPPQDYRRLVVSSKTGDIDADRVLDDYIDDAWYYMISGCMLTSSLFWVLLIPTLIVIIRNHWTVQKAKKRIEPLRYGAGHDGPATYVPAA